MREVNSTFARILSTWPSTVRCEMTSFSARAVAQAFCDQRRYLGLALGERAGSSHTESGGRAQSALSAPQGELAEVGGFIANRFAAGQRRFSSRATHSTWWVIGESPMVLSVTAILCDWLYPTGETAL